MAIGPVAPFKNNRARKVLACLEGNWQAEMEGYYTYLALAGRETDALRATVLRHLAAAELDAISCRNTRRVSPRLDARLKKAGR